MTIYLETLGCSRNRVDSEIMLGKLAAAGHKPVDDPSRARVIIVNTCTFISTASDEAVDVILQLAKYKETGTCNRLIVTGCLAQRYKDDENLAAGLPEVDAFLGTGACDQIVDAVENRETGTLTLFPDPNRRAFQNTDEKRSLLSGHYAFIKVSEGCNRTCTYCIIPQLRGKQRSRPVADICMEAENLAAEGIKEIILTAENTTDYGRDLEGDAGFDLVLNRVGRSLEKTDTWVRMLYTHPNTLTPAVIEAVKNNKNICAYYDVPIQHASSGILRRMGRPYTQEDLTALFNTIRKTDPEAALRTTLIVGFPGETEDDFDQLLDFIKTVRFDHLGVFTYSDADDLKSHLLRGHVPPDVAEQRHDRLMAAQAEISESINETHVGRIYPVLVEENPEPGVYVGRTRFQAPEVDGVTFIYSDALEIGTIVKVRMTDAFEYDLAGERA